jgi:shikimate dehydrogenase
MIVSGKTKVCAIIGDPVEHSLSPIMHNAAFQKLGLNLFYVAFTVSPSGLKDAVLGAKSLGLRGLNVTMPYKNDVIEYLDEVDATAEVIGAVNTILNSNGRLTGYNTDGTGALIALQENGVSTDEAKMVLIGAGGAAKAIAYEAAQDVDQLVILNRTPENAQQLAKGLNKRFDANITGEHLSYVSLKKELKDAAVLVNATPMGMNPNVDRSPVPSELLRADLAVMDIIYHPLETRLLKDAKAAGAKAVSGLEMLVHQGAAAFEIWTNCPAPVEIMKNAALLKLQEEGAC